MAYKFFFLAAVLVVSLTLIVGSPVDKDNKTTEATLEETSSTLDKVDPLEPLDLGEEVYHYSSEDIERTRWISVSRDGEEIKETDEEVIRILEYARLDNSPVRFSESSNLTEDEVDQVTGKEKRSIIGLDSRYKYPRYGLRGRTCALAYMQNGCTAFLVGPRHAITTGHCVYDFTNRRWKTNIGMYVGRDCYSYGRFADWSRAWVLDVNGNARSNMAFIRLTSTFTAPCWIGYGYRDPMPTTHVETCGYHGDKRYTGIYPCYYCSHCYAQLEVINILSYRITYNTRMRSTCDNFNAPGSPMVTNTGYAWGVHSHESSSYNFAVRITRERFYTICQWLCDNGARCSELC